MTAERKALLGRFNFNQNVQFETLVDFSINSLVYTSYIKK